jgi:hypothetical protein
LYQVGYGNIAGYVGVSIVPLFVVWALRTLAVDAAEVLVLESVTTALQVVATSCLARKGSRGDNGKGVL